MSKDERTHGSAFALSTYFGRRKLEKQLANPFDALPKWMGRRYLLPYRCPFSLYLPPQICFVFKFNKFAPTFFQLRLDGIFWSRERFVSDVVMCRVLEVIWISGKPFCNVRECEELRIRGEVQVGVLGIDESFLFWKLKFGWKALK